MTSSAYQVLPASSFYWARLDTSILPSPEKPTDEQLLFLLESWLPVPLEEVHAVFLRVDDAAFVGCAIERSKLEGIESTSLSLTPEALPEGLNESGDASSFNLLTGPFTPLPIAKKRRMSRLILLGAMVAASLLVVLGLQRRASDARSLAASLRADETRMIEEALGSGPGASALPPRLQLESELRSLRQTRTKGVVTVIETDASHSLSQVLESWPENLLVKTDSIVVADDTVRIRATVPSGEEAEQLSAALEKASGWTSGVPSVRRTRDGVAVSVSLARTTASEDE